MYELVIEIIARDCRGVLPPMLGFAQAGTDRATQTIQAARAHRSGAACDRIEGSDLAGLR